MEGKLELKQRILCADCQKGTSQERTRVLTWNFKGVLKGEDQMPKKLYMLATTNTTATATFDTTTTPTTTSIATATNTKSIEIQILGSFGEKLN